MNQNNFILYILWCLLGVLYLSCNKDYRILPDCDANPKFKLSIQDNPCIPPSCKVLITNESTGRIDNVLWYFGDGNSSSEKPETFQYEYTQSDSFTVTMTVFAEGCEEKSITQKLVIGVEPPITKFISETDRCILERENCSLYFKNESENADSYEWYINDNLVKTTRDLNYDFQQPGNYIIKLVTTNAGGSTEKDTVITIRPLTFLEIPDFDNNTDLSEGIFGVTEAGGNSGYNLMMNNTQECYTASTDIFGLNQRTSVKYDLGTLYSKLTPNTFIKVKEEFFLVGKGSKGGGDNDIFIAKTNLSFSGFTIEEIFEPFAGTRENAFGIAETEEGYVVIGNKTDSEQEGVYLVEINHNLNKIGSTTLFNSNQSAEGKFILKVDDSYWLSGTWEEDAQLKTYFTTLNNVFKPNGDAIELGNELFKANRIIQISENEALIIGNANGVAKAVKITIGKEEFDWSKPYNGWVFKDGIYTDEKRVILVGKNGQLPGWIELNASGEEVTKETYNHTEFETGEILSISTTSDGGFILGGRARRSGIANFPILIKTDNLGKVDVE